MDIINGYLITLDAVGILMFTLNLMANDSLSLFQIISRFSTYHKKEQKVRCPSNIKGKIMRSLMEKMDYKVTEIIEGIKFEYGDAWILVIPDVEEPLCKIYTESKDVQLVEKISNEFAKKIEEMVDENNCINK